MLGPYIKNCLPLFEELKELTKIVLSPLPRYLTGGCCQDDEHAPNRHDAGFRRKIIGGLERLRKTIRDQLVENGVRNFKVINPLWLLAGPKTTDEALQETIEASWEADAVHPTNEGYRKIVSGLRVAARDLLEAGDRGVKKAEASGVVRHPEWAPSRGTVNRGRGPHMPVWRPGTQSWQRGVPRGRPWVRSRRGSFAPRYRPY